MDDFRALARRFSKAAQNFVKTAYAALWMKGWKRWAVWISFGLGLLTVVMNTWLAGYINHRVLPQKTETLTRIVERDVSLGKVKWLLPTGFIGLTPIATVGPVEIGPGEIEKSELRVTELKVGLDCVRSAMRREVVMSVHCNDAELKLVQADNYSWFGRPVDTSPPSSDFVPGLRSEEERAQEESNVEAGSFMGSSIEDSLIRNLAKWTQELSRMRNESERRMSQYACSTSDKRTPNKGRHVLASLSTDAPRDNNSDEMSSGAAPKMPIKQSSVKSPGEQQTQDPFNEVGAQKRWKLGKEPRETSHGVKMKHFVRPQPSGQIKHRRRPTEPHKKRKEDQETQQAKTLKAHPIRSQEIESPLTEETSTTTEAPEQTEEPEVSQTATQAEETLSEKSEEVIESVESDQQEEEETDSHETGSENDVSIEEVKNWAGAVWHQFSKDFKSPQFAVGYLRFNRSTILAYTTQEEIAREFVNVKATAELGSGYHTMKIDMAADAHKRNPESVKWTRLSPNAPTHLRFVTPGARRTFDRHFPKDITKASIARQKSSPLPSKSQQALLGVLDPLAKSDPPTNEEDKSVARGPPFSSLSAGPSLLQNTISHEGLYDVRSSPTKPFPPPSRQARQVVPKDKRRTEGRPKGGSISIALVGNSLFLEDIVPDLRVAVTGKQLHAPLLERVLEVPMDIQDGHVNGTVYITANTARTWQMPQLDGHVMMKDVDLHFWDAPDHLSKASFELRLERNRLYFHDASANFGAVPLIISGDMDVDPEFGEYRLTAVVPPVDINVVRATFGIRPTPNPVAGALQGRVHCTGSLREPMFSGAINCTQPARKMMDTMEESQAKAALRSLPGAVGAFDKVPFTAGKVLFTHDTSTDVFTVHDFVARPAGGGKVRGSGQLWVAPVAEQDPQALHFRCEGQGVAAKELIKRYIPESVELPKVLDCGATNFKMSMKGSHAAPVTEIKWEAPSVQVRGEASLSRTEWKATAAAPAFELSGTLHTQFPDFESTKQIYTQREMTQLCQPKITGVDSDINLKGCDMLPLFSNTQTPSRTRPGQTVRLKVTGNTHIKARHVTAEHGDDSHPQHFQGDVTLQGLRMNQVNLAKQLNGQLDVSPTRVSLTAKGLRDDEVLDFSIELPETGDWLSHSTTSGDETSRPEGSDIHLREDRREQHGFVKGGRFSLKQGRLDISSQVNSETNRVQMQIHGLTLDELELASLRGELQDLSLDLNFQKREGRGEVYMTKPRYSGLLGEALSGGFRWERDVVRLEKMVLQQEASKYEVQGEYSFPSNIQQQDLELSTADAGPNWLPDEVLAATAQPYIGRWRVQVHVPNADVQEILPAMRLLNQATTARDIDYEKAKEDFLRGVKDGGATSPTLKEFVQNIHRKREVEKNSVASEASATAPAALPGIQSLKGTWEGTVQAFGGGGGASTVDFNLRGHSWKWGDYEVDEAVAAGGYHSAEGAHLREISMRTGDARFALQGDLFGPKQEASFILHDFPAALLSPLYKSVPALQNAVPNVTEHTPGLKRLMEYWERTKTTLGLSDVKEDTPMEKLTKGSPVNGLLFVRGTLGGSVEEPQGFVRLDLYDGMIGTTQLAAASAQVELNSQQTIHFRLESTPLESKGLLFLKGSVPLPRSDDVSNSDVRLCIRDGGMALVAAMVPDFKWETGSADIDFSACGDITDPDLEGKARVSRATLTIPNLKYPLKHTSGAIRVENGRLLVDNFDAKSGNYGHIKAKGSLPLFKERADHEQHNDALDVHVSRLELKANSLYNGRLDSHLKFCRCLKEPVVSGDIEISKGNLVLQFGAFSNAPPAQETATSTTTHRPGVQDINFPPLDSIIAAPPPVINIPKQVSMDGVQLENLKLKLGSELRFQVPFMVNLLVSGGIEVSGPPQDLKPAGEIYIDGGIVNLFATQLSIDRDDSPGTVRFVPEQGFDPELDITLTSSAEGFKAICKSRASTWQENVVLRFRGVEGTDEENLSQAARLFQTKLADALVAENGQLALLNLAASTMATMSPRLDTWGRIGAARWRLVSAPNIPYLLTTSERLELQDIVTTLLSGTEIEVQYGPTQAVIAHKLRGSSFGTECSLALNLTDNLKVSADVVGTIEDESIGGLTDQNSVGLFTWRIEKYSSYQTDQPIFSPTFMKSGFQWRMRIFPLGTQEDENPCMSIHLCFPREENFFSEPPCAKTMFRVKNQRKGQDVMQSTFKFNSFAQNSMWGFPYFAKVDQLFDEGSGLIVNDALIVELSLVVQQKDTMTTPKLNNEKAKTSAVVQTEIGGPSGDLVIESGKNTQPVSLPDLSSHKPVDTFETTAKQVALEKSQESMSSEQSSEETSISSSESDESKEVDDQDKSANAFFKKALRNLHTGALFAEKYLVTEKVVLGKPNIRFAENVISGDNVVLKFYASREVFENSCRFHKLLSKTQIVCKLLDIVDRNDGFPPCAVLERARHTLDEWIEKKKPNSFERRSVLLEILSAIRGLHDHNVVHCDLKPANIMMFLNYEWKLVDLDSAVVPDQPAEILATVTYAAPEIVKAGRERCTELAISTAADMWSFGIMVFEVLSGERFYGAGADLSFVEEQVLSGSFMPHLNCVGDKHAQRFVRKLLRTKPEDRLTATRAIKSSIFKFTDITSTRLIGD